MGGWGKHVTIVTALRVPVVSVLRYEAVSESCLALRERGCVSKRRSTLYLPGHFNVPMRNG